MVVIPTSEGLDDLQPAVILANNLLKKGIPARKVAFALCITSDSARELAAARAYLGETAYTVLDGDIPFRAAFKTAMDQGKAVTETSFPTLRKRADAMAQSIIDAVAATGEREVAWMADLARLATRTRPQGNAAGGGRDQLEPDEAAARQAGPERRRSSSRVPEHILDDFARGGGRALRLPEGIEVGPVHRHVGRVPGTEDGIAGYQGNLW